MAGPGLSNSQDHENNKFYDVSTELSFRCGLLPLSLFVFVLSFLFAFLTQSSRLMPCAHRPAS